MAVLDITPIFLAVGVVFSLILIMLREWYYEDIGLMFLGFVMFHIGLYQDLRPLFYLGWLFVILGMALAVINLVLALATLLGKKVTIDIFHTRRR